MKLSDLNSVDHAHDRRMAEDPEYAREVHRNELADAIAIAVLTYRTDKGLTQTQFAQTMGWKQPHVARLERGDSVPSLDSLEKLARAGVLEVHIEREDTVVRRMATA